MDMKVEPEPQTTLRAGRTRLGAKRLGVQGFSVEGFTLLEVVCVLAIIAMLAAVVIPTLPHATSLPRIEGYAIETATLLNADHVAAQQQHRQIATFIDAPSRMIQSGAFGTVLQLPSDVTVNTVLARRCNGRPAGATIDYLPSGMSCGGVVSLTRAGLGFQVRVNWLTGGAEVVPVH
jgi:general secretion pathway protein H